MNAIKNFIKELIEAWIESRRAYVKSRMIDGHWM